MANFEAKVNAVLDSSSFESQISALTKPRELKIIAKPDGFDKSIDKIANGKQVTVKVKATDAEKEAARIKAQFEKIQVKIGTGKIDADFAKVQTNISKLNNESSALTSNMTKLSAAYKTINDSAATDSARVNAWKEFNNLLPAINSQISILSKKEKEAAQEVKNITKNAQDSLRAEKLGNDITAWMNKNQAAATQFGSVLTELKNQLNLDPSSVKNVSLEFAKVKSEAQAAGLVTNSFAASLKNFGLQALGITSGIAAFRKGIQTVKQMAQETIKVDTAMTELYRVTNLSSDQYSALYDNMVKSAKSYGAELDTMINSTASWVRLGFDANVANKLAEVSTMYQHVTDLDEKTAVDNLVTAYMGFKDSLLEITNGDEVAAITRISDVFDKLGNELPVTASNVAEGLTKNASVMQSAGASLEEAAAMVVGSGSVSQDFAKSGTALKIFTLRVHGMKGELEELGEEVDENVISTSKMQTQILNLTKGAVNIFEEDGRTFRNIYNIAKDLAEVLPTLDAADQAELLETVAGKSRSNDILNLLTNFEMTEKALAAAQDAAGTSAKENAIYMDSIKGRMDALKASWQALSSDFIQSDFLKNLVSAATTFLNVLDSIVSKLGTMRTLFTGGAIFAGVKAFKSIS